MYLLAIINILFLKESLLKEKIIGKFCTIVKNEYPDGKWGNDFKQVDIYLFVRSEVRLG